tara:strand:- start:28 stop:372 length:345 start_codon:yes stop_codon:yes gene_type:complete
MKKYTPPPEFTLVADCECDEGKVYTVRESPYSNYQANIYLCPRCGFVGTSIDKSILESSVDDEEKLYLKNLLKDAYQYVGIAAPRTQTASKKYMTVMKELSGFIRREKNERKDN